MKAIHYAPEAFRYLNGLFCVYKPAGLCIPEVNRRLAGNIARDLNALETRPPKDMVVIKGSVQSGRPLSVNLTPNLADHVSVVGPRYQSQDIQLRNMSYLTRNMSGVLVMAINDGCKGVRYFRSKNHMQVIEVNGKFGYATDTFFENGKVLEKATFKHIKQDKLERCLSSIQASHQAQAFTYAGVRLDSQAAYELASKGPLRTEGEITPIIHSIACTDFSPPNFKLKIHCTNSTEEYLSELVHEIGLNLKSCAVCCQIRQIQFDHFTLEHSLLRKHWTVEHIISNIVLCQKIVDASNLFAADPHIRAIDRSVVENAIKELQEDAKMHLLRSESEMEVENNEEISISDNIVQNKNVTFRD